MAEEIKASKLETFGLSFTKIYLVALFGGIPVAFYFGMIEIKALELNELGDFLAGAFGPLAIFWLVLGFFQQGRELRFSVQALNYQAEELKNSVAQQRAMVKITERQLDLDIEVREEQNALARSKELPLFQLHSRGNTGVPNSGGRRKYMFALRNIGQSASYVRISLNSENVQLNAPNWAYTEPGKVHEFNIETLVGHNFPDGEDIEAKIESANIRDQVRTQQFTIGNFQPVEISCEPPRV